MRILVTGAEGNIGSRLVPYVKSMGHDIFRLDQIQGCGDDYLCGNILNYSELSVAFEKFKPEVVYHLAAMVSRVVCERSPNLTVRTNVIGTYNVIQLCKIYNAKLIYFSTSEVYGNIGGLLSEDRQCEPNNIYGLTKYIGEQLVQYEGIDYVIVRPFMIYYKDEKLGDNHSAIIRFFDNLNQKKKITVHKNSLRSWLYLTDALIIIEKLVALNKSIINIGSDEAIYTQELAKMICSRFGLNYNEYVEEIELPEKMTLEKYPDLSIQRSLGYEPVIKIDEGLNNVLSRFQ